MSSSAQEDYEVEAANIVAAESTPLLGGGIDAVIPYDGAPSSSEAGPKKKKEKSGQKLVADALKTDMAAERTFFKWLWTGLHTGAIGTFIFVTFDDDASATARFYVVGFAWIVAFALVLFGLYCYNRRRRALRLGRLDEIPVLARDYGPYIVVAALLAVVLAGFGYALWSGATPKERHKGDAFRGVEAVPMKREPVSVRVFER